MRLQFLGGLIPAGPFPERTPSFRPVLRQKEGHNPSSEASLGALVFKTAPEGERPFSPQKRYLCPSVDPQKHLLPGFPAASIFHTTEKTCS